MAIIILSGLLFFPFLGGVHLFDWDEINFAECAREMIVSGDHLRPQIDFMPFWEKPPLFIWMQVVSMRLFGINEFAARFPNALVGVMTLVAIYHCGRRLVSHKMGQWWAVLFAASWLPHFYFKTGIIDPTFNLLIFLAFYQVHVLRTGSRAWLHAIAGGLLLGMAALTKGPVAILVALLALGVYIVLHRGLNGYKIKHLLAMAVFAAVPFGLWVGITTAVHGTEYGTWFLREFIQYQVRLFSTEDSDHGGPFIYHFVVLLLGCFPASAFLFQYLGRKREKVADTGFATWMWLLFWVVLLLFSIVKTKIVHYSSLCYFPLTYLAALQLYALSEGKERLRKGTAIVLLVTGILLAVVIALLPAVGINKAVLIPYIADPFAVANLRADVQWSYAACVPGIIYLAIIIAAARMMRQDLKKGMTLLAITQVVAIQFVLLYCAPRIEGYSQRAAIEYYKSFSGKKVYVQPLGHKSYANLFYTAKQPYNAPEYRGVRKDKTGRETPEANGDWLIYGNTDRPAYFICKVHDSAEYARNPQLEVTGSSNGFVFLKRKQ
ncbi:phospholipid carrier-dependent glycosyltransferase [Nemorincola caseinilytica]|uniref:Phospholipid carrier-dependent glycosyltransferase n=1 Tax=Nemorincola caseinilytica TaxID=2054315 RepID=A0ABP8NNJ8_9BACT